MITKANGIARLLQRDILLASENIQRADRRVEIFAAKQESAYCPINAVEIERLVKQPTAFDECKKRVNATADNGNVERITVVIACLVRGATLQLRQLLAKSREIDGFYCVRRINVSKIDVLDRIGEAIDRQHKSEPKHLPIGLKADLNQLQTALTVRKDEPRNGSPL